MPFNGSGVFVRLYSWVADKNNGLDIIALRMDDDTDDITINGLGDCLTRDGQGSASADLPMNGFRHTNVGASNAANQYGTVSQIQGNSYLFATGAGTGDAITATFAPPITPANGTQVYVTAPAANTITTPTFNAATITKNGGSALSVGEYGTGYPLTLRYRSAGPSWELLSVSGLPSIAASRLLGNATVGTAIPTAITTSQALDFVGSTQGDLTYRGSSAWAVLAPGTNGQVLRTQGAAANPTWSDVTRHSQVFTGTGTFTVPANATVATVFKFTVIGGGGGGGGVITTAGASAGGGATGAIAVADLSGFTASSSVTITIGAAGTGTTSSGGTGGTSKMTYAAVDVISSVGGGGGLAANNTTQVAGGTAGAATIAVGASGLTLVSSYSGGVQGCPSAAQGIPGDGAATVYGTGGKAFVAGGAGGNGMAGTNGSGGGGAFRNGSDQSGGAGGAGFVLVEWVL